MENPEVMADWRRIAREQPMRRRGFVGQLLAAIGHDTSRRLKNIRIPTLVVSGDADKLIHVDNSRHLATAIPGALLELLPGAGHDIPLERPRELAQLIIEFALA